MTASTIKADKGPLFTEENPVIFILLGPPGAGKGTVASPLSNYFKIPSISTGDLFREHLRNKTQLGIEANKYISLGKLVPDEIVIGILFDRLQREDAQNGFILDGFPRTISQATLFNQKIKEDELTVIHLELEDDLLAERITGRLVCKGCGKTYHKLFNPPQTEEVCDKCNGSLYQRNDDREEILKKRLEVYRKETAPLVAFYRDKMISIDGSRDKSQVLEEILGKFSSKLNSF